MEYRREVRIGNLNRRRQLGLKLQEKKGKEKKGRIRGNHTGRSNLLEPHEHTRLPRRQSSQVYCQRRSRPRMTWSNALKRIFWSGLLKMSATLRVVEIHRRVTTPWPTSSRM